MKGGVKEGEKREERRMREGVLRGERKYKERLEGRDGETARKRS